MKKFLAGLLSLAIIATVLPMTVFASDEVTTLILDDNGMVSINGGKYEGATSSSVDKTNLAKTNEATLGSPINGGAIFMQSVDDPGYIIYKPDLDEGLYRVSYYRPTTEYLNGVTLSGAVTATIPYQTIGAGWVDVGVFEFSGKPEDDAITVGIIPDAYKKSWYTMFDAIKFEKIVKQEVAFENYLILEENGKVSADGGAYVDYSTNVVENNINRDWGTESFDTTRASDGSAITVKTTKTGDNVGNLTYKPDLPAGKYEVYWYKTRGFNRNGMKFSGRVTGQYGYNANDPGESKSGWVSLGMADFTGNPEEDAIVVTTYDTYNTTTTYFDAFKFVKLQRQQVTFENYLILEEDGSASADGGAYVNYNTNVVEVNAPSMTSGTHGTSSNGAALIGKPAKDAEQEEYIVYKPDLERGVYKVSYYAPHNGYRNGLEFDIAGKAKYLEGAWGDARPKGWIEMGTYVFNGDSQTDYIKVKTLNRENYSASGYVTCFDALKFEKVSDIEIAVSSAEIEDGTYTAVLEDFGYTGETFDVVVAMYQGEEQMLVQADYQPDIIITTNGSTTINSTVVAGYDKTIHTVKIFLFEDIGTLKPVKALR